MQNRIPFLTIMIVAGFFGSILLLNLFSVIPAGHVGVKDFFGKVSEQPLQPGIHLVFPMTRVIKFDIRTREDKETASVPTSEGLVVKLDVSFIYHITPEKAVTVYKTVGRNYEQVIIEPQIRSVIRDVTAGYEAKFLYSASREQLAQSMLEHSKKLLEPRGIEAEMVLLRNVELPRLLTSSIEEKLQAEQQSQRMRFVVDKERQEAERKSVEAKGIAEFQKIVSNGINEQLLKWKAIEVASELSKSPNAKIIVLGDKHGLPIILSDK